MLRTNAAGQRVLELSADGSAIYFQSPSATPTGDKPFVATMPISGGKETILFRTADPYYVEPISLLGDGNLLIQCESVQAAPNYFTVSMLAGTTKFQQLTQFPNPYSGLRLPSK